MAIPPAGGGSGRPPLGNGSAGPARHSGETTGQTDPPFRIRPARASDRPALTAMLMRCTPETRQRRGNVLVFPEPYLTEALAHSPEHLA